MRALTRCAAASTLALASAAFAAPDPCNTCEDLCRLVDQYLQKEKQLELYQQYAGPKPQKLPRAGESAPDAVYREFEEWTAQRELPCVIPLGAQLESALRSAAHRVFGSGDSAGNTQTDLETHPGDSSCKITFGKDELGSGDTQQRFEEWVNCKPMSDATIEHEKVHQARCLQEYESSPKDAAAVLAEPSVMAESEVLAHQRHKEILEVAIRDIIQTQGCGWDPTDRQKADPRSVPSLKQMQDMNRRANSAARLLNTPSFKH
jgi:hypothetical protein